MRRAFQIVCVAAIVAALGSAALADVYIYTSDQDGDASDPDTWDLASGYPSHDPPNLRFAEVYHNVNWDTSSHGRITAHTGGFVTFGSDSILGGGVSMNGGTVDINGRQVHNSAGPHGWSYLKGGTIVDSVGGGYLHASTVITGVGGGSTTTVGVDFRVGKEFALNSGSMLVDMDAGGKLTVNTTNHVEGILHSDGGTLTIDFLNMSPGDWGLRWLYDSSRVTQLQTLITDGGLIILNEDNPSLYYSDPTSGGDGYTYLGATSPVPVPGAVLLGAVGLSMVGAYTRKRRLAHVMET